MTDLSFAHALLQWYDACKRDLPWRRTCDPYAIWVSEIMLQQTRVETAIGYFERFMRSFPDVFALAGASQAQVLKAWEGLGYYSRARNLHSAAQRIVSQYGGHIPCDMDALRALPGIGAYTAGAVGSIAFGLRVPAIDGNVERVIARVCGIREDVGIPSVKRALHGHAQALLPPSRVGDYNQAMMELGARICTPGTPDCEGCPVRAFCSAAAEGDAELLPVKQRARAPKSLQYGVALVLYGNTVLLEQREARLLQGLWVFPMAENATTPDALVAHLGKCGIRVRFLAHCGHARHVFTHLVWEMDLMAFAATEQPTASGTCWASLAMLDTLALPTAMRAAKHAATGLLMGQDA